MVLRDYEENQARLAKAIDASLYLLGDLKNFNGEKWTVRYPHIRSADGQEPSLPHRPGMARRTLTFADEPASSTDVVLSSVPSRRALKRSLTLAPAQADAEVSTEVASTSRTSDDFSILRLDLNIGAARHAKGLISQLEKASISALLDNRISASLDHLALLQKRVHDAHSRVLVTGDLNAGKSTLINALLRRHDVMPTDQQPLTTRFVEVVSAKENDGKEEIHVLHEDGSYNPVDESTYTKEGIERLESIATDYDSDPNAPPLRVFLKEAPKDIANPSILHNGIVDISLIDAPGLNRDSIKTTANFARQEEIDVVVFVVSAANHFTLSAKEFIWQAGHEKAHLFIVVNRFDQIRDKERCRRAVLEQIKQLSPETYKDAADLVHFVDSAKVALGCENEETDDLDQAFSHLEHSLRSFVLVNRAKSKLGPAQNYVTHLLADVELLASANALVAAKEREAARLDIDRVKPVLEEMKKGKEGLEESLVQEEEAATDSASTRTQAAMVRGLERIGQGQLAAPAPGLALPTWTGVLGVWDYAKETKRVMLASLDFAASLAEQDARRITSEGVERVILLGDKHLPADVERSKRVFNPNAMFSARPSSKLRSSSSITSLGLGLVHRPQMTEVNISDIFDLQHHLVFARNQLPSTSSSTSKDLIPYTEVGGLGVASLAVGAFTMSGKLLGARQIIDGVLRISDIASHPMTRKWIGPVIGVCTVGAVVYVLYELPATIPRNVGRHIQATLSAPQDGAGDTEASWPEQQAQRVSKEVRKVMRLASWDLRERFKAAVDEKVETVRESEEVEKKAGKALGFFAELERKVEDIREQVGIKV